MPRRQGTEDAGASGRRRQDRADQPARGEYPQCKTTELKPSRSMQPYYLRPPGLYAERRELTTHERMITEPKELRPRGSMRRSPVPRYRRRGCFRMPNARPRNYLCTRKISAVQAHGARQSAGRKLSIQRNWLWPPGEYSVLTKNISQITINGHPPARTSSAAGKTRRASRVNQT